MYAAHDVSGYSLQGGMKMGERRGGARCTETGEGEEGDKTYQKQETGGRNTGYLVSCMTVVV